LGHSVVPSGGACGAAGARTHAACPSVQGGGAAQNIEHDGRVHEYTWRGASFIPSLTERATHVCTMRGPASVGARKTGSPCRGVGGAAAARGSERLSRYSLLPNRLSMLMAIVNCSSAFLRFYYCLYICATCYCFRSQGCSYHRSAWRCGSHSDVLRRYRATLPHDVANHAGSTLWKDLSRAPPSLPDANAPTPRNRTMPSDASVAWDLLVHQAALILWYFQFVSV